MAAPIPSDEPRRLEALAQYQILDTPAEPIYDEIAELAVRRCALPVALVSLVDRDRQWFKAKVGVNVQQTSRDISFCAHAILQRDTFVVPDASIDARFADNPLVAGAPNLRFYAGTPLVTPDNLALGTLCVLDYQPHELLPEQNECLWHLNRQVMVYLELRRRLVALQQSLRTNLDTTHRRRLEGDIHFLEHLAVAVQNAGDFDQALQFLLQFLCEASGWPLAAAWTPAADGSVLEASSAYYTDTRELSLLQRLSSAGKGPRVDLEELERFRILGERLLFRPGEGLQGRVWSTGIPEKWPPASSMRSPIIDMRLQLARLAGLRSGIAVPLIVEGQVLAVLVFFSWQVHPPYEALLRLLANTTQLPSEPLAGIAGEH